MSLPNTTRCPHCQKLNHDLLVGTNMCLRCGEEFEYAGASFEVDDEDELFDVQHNRTRAECYWDKYEAENGPDL